MRLWGYYVAPSENVALPVQEASRTKPKEIKVLWVGRLLNWKRVDTIVRAISEYANLKREDTSLPEITLDIYGTGPEEHRLKGMCTGLEDVVCFHAPIPISEVRAVMREHDIYVLSSNAYEGWGAVVSEAIEEHLSVIGTYEAGSCATMLSKDSLFHAGDWRGLLKLLEEYCAGGGVGSLQEGTSVWSAKAAADALMELISNYHGNKTKLD